ncbi:MAG: hypothetical protein ACQESB_07005 [Elusimicrobiota bacterium]
MKKISALALIFLLTGCAVKPPSPPNVDFSGIMRINGAFGKARGNFRINGYEDSFVVIFSGPAGIPLGEIAAEGEEVSIKGLPRQMEISYFFKYWPVLFWPARGSVTDSLKFGEIKIEYRNWQKTSNGYYPRIVEIKSPEASVTITMQYGS